MTMLKAVLASTLFGIVQSVPIILSFLINGIVGVGSSFLLRKQRKDEFGIRIVNHTALLLGTWVLISGMIGLFFTFAELESAPNGGSFNGILYGFRVAMALMPVGVVACSIPVIWLLRSRSPVRPS